MDIKKRINARKIVLSYFYQHCFFSLLSKRWVSWNEIAVNENFELENWENKWKFFDDEFLKAVEKKKQEILHRDEILQEKIDTYAKDYNIEWDFWYILKNFFDQWSASEVDVDYVLQVGIWLSKYEDELIDKVNHHTKSFWYEQMDPIDETLLLLWYVEYKTINTPKEVVINEMVELAKRYADEWSPKLINGILHEIFLAEEK
jgi:N utilization substance protein B